MGQEQSANKRLFIYETPRRKAHRSESAFPDNRLFRRVFLPSRKCLRREDAAKIHIFPIMNQEKMKKSFRTSSFFLLRHIIYSEKGWINRVFFECTNLYKLNNHSTSNILSKQDGEMAGISVYG